MYALNIHVYVPIPECMDSVQDILQEKWLQLKAMMKCVENHRRIIHWMFLESVMKASIGDMIGQNRQLVTDDGEITGWSSRLQEN